MPSQTASFSLAGFDRSFSSWRNFGKKKLINNADCPRCDLKPESINHVLFECGFARLVWAVSPAGFIFYPLPSESILTNIAELMIIEDDVKADRILLWPWLIWKIWKDRNELCFTSSNGDAESLVQLALDDCKAWNLANLRVPPPQVSLVSLQSNAQIWKKPISGFFKCNVDGSWSDTAETCGIGWILRDEYGTGRWFGSKTFPKLHSPLDVEAAALVWVMSVIDNLGFTNVAFEMDCKILYQAVKDPTDWPRLQNYTSEIFKTRRHLLPSFFWVNRTANAAADLIAKKAISFFVYSAQVNCTMPNWLMPILERDTICINQNSS